MHRPALAAVALLAGSFAASAQDLSLDTKRMLSYGSTAVIIRACNLPITASENSGMMAALQKYSEAQTQLSPDEFKEMMQTAGAQIGQNKDAVCAAAAQKSVADMLAEAEAGQ